MLASWAYSLYWPGICSLPVCNGGQKCFEIIVGCMTHYWFTLRRFAMRIKREATYRLL